MIVSRAAMRTISSGGGPSFGRVVCRASSVLLSAPSSNGSPSCRRQRRREAGASSPSSSDDHNLLSSQHRRRASSSSSSSDFDAIVKSAFPGSVPNSALVTRVSAVLSSRSIHPPSTLLCTSLCADELARQLERDFGDVYGRNNFALGGLSGFPFAGNTGFGAMSAHVPDGGYCLLVHAPHVGISRDGTVGKVERAGMAHTDGCCGSAIAASNYLKGITHGGAAVNTKGLRPFADFQQSAVQELILPFGKRLADAGPSEEDRMKELPYALYESQDSMVRDIVDAGKGGIKGGLALLGGVQINTGDGAEDYFHPLRFDLYDGDGVVVESMLGEIAD